MRKVFSILHSAYLRRQVFSIVWVVVLVGVRLRPPVKVLAGDEACPAEYPYCYDYTIVNQWACETCPGSPGYACSIDLRNCDPGGSEGQAICDLYNAGYCYQVCKLDDGTVWQGGVIYYN